MHSSGEVSDRNYLRNQTYRFANTSVIDYATEKNGIVDIGYSYMRHPYEVFTRGKNGPGRNPENIIEGAIRDIMQAQFTRKRIRSLVPS